MVALEEEKKGTPMDERGNLREKGVPEAAKAKSPPKTGAKTIPEAAAKALAGKPPKAAAAKAQVAPPTTATGRTKPAPGSAHGNDKKAKAGAKKVFGDNEKPDPAFEDSDESSDEDAGETKNDKSGAATKGDGEDDDTNKKASGCALPLVSALLC